MWTAPLRHVDHSVTAGVPETVDHSGVTLEVMLHDGPLNGKRTSHNGASNPASGPISCKNCMIRLGSIGINVEYDGCSRH